MPDKETVNKNEQQNATNKADDFDKEKEVTAVSTQKSSTNSNTANEEVIKK